MVGKALDQVAIVQRAHPGLRVEEVGDASGEKAVSESLEEDFSKAELTSLPITLLILIVVFGSLLAAGVPLLLALTAVGATIGILGPFSHVFGAVAEQIDSVVLLIGLAVGVDYSIFYLRREREERAAGAGERASLEAAAATSGRAILVSGFTVMVAMAGMYIAGDATFASLRDRDDHRRRRGDGRLADRAAGAAGLARRPDREGADPVPGSRAAGRAPEGSRVWGALVDPRHAAASSWLRRRSRSPGSAILAIPAFSLHTANAGVSGLPKDMPIVNTFDRVQAAFPGGVEPAEVAISAADVKAPPVAHAVEAAARADRRRPARLRPRPGLPRRRGRQGRRTAACRWPATAPTRARRRRWRSSATT